ncbi:hypothetical protein THAOC_25566 [Thalassiosira oceanica]|uniref:Uncharacterized protein n=1 Tax=Thalassiosira oceanica TaxID=159749 RepID=K0RM46_THAOC|nr:hypothetical protein THAOC_25566 [Thalassiosira oceanica]|mmetsp:Transcript_16008/g.36625  ORF Transcript_16008/g.36625 Transcript_16008/m.36625 type:complete len:348 (+) Transcript_16008:60-1103(+)|eukprot:EJK54778.1 hypothetical protein THAOC_25566 [Thalassiosira oceanica]
MAPKQRRCFLVCGIVALVCILIEKSPTASAAIIPRCDQFSEEYDIRNAARDQDVLLIVHESDDADLRRNLCNKLTTTPRARLEAKDLRFAYMELTDGHEETDNGEWNPGTRGFATTSLGAKMFPALVYISKGMDGKSKYKEHTTSYSGSVESDAIDMASVEKWIESKIGFRLGNDIYNIVFFDSVASLFMSYGDAKGLNKLKQRGLALMVRFSTLFSFKEPFSSIGAMYNRAFKMSFEHGVSYCEEQVGKLEKKLEKHQSNLSSDKKHEFQQKLAILKSFSDPKELSPEDVRQILIHGVLHIGLILATLLLLILPSEENDGDEEEEAVNAVPVEAKVVVEDVKPKKE